MPKFLTIGLAASGIAAAAATAGFQAGVTYTNKQVGDTALPNKLAKEVTTPSVLVQEVVKEVHHKRAVADNHLAKNVESMTRCLALDQELARKIAAERVERAQWTAEEAVQKAIADQKATTERAGRLARERDREEKEAEMAREKRARMTTEEKEQEQKEHDELEFFIRCKEYGGATDTFT